MPAQRIPKHRPPIEVYADPLTAAYENVVDRLLMNIAAHFNTSDPTVATLEWQFKKLAELGKLTQENLAIIAEMTGQNNRLLREALTRAAIDALDGIEPLLLEAVKKGLLSGASGSMMSARVLDILNAYERQALDVLNLVNTVMLQSSLEQYRKVIMNTMMYEKQLAAAQVILNQSTAGVILGAQSRQQALRQAVKDMAAQGLYGFTDKAGRHWSPEAYVNMDIRTTAGNVATEATFARNADYGNDLIWWPILSAARPGCYPWQGKVCSTSNRSGVVEDLDGKLITIHPLSSTSYGEPAGIGGINCHHKPPNIFIPGLSKVRGSVPGKDANEAKYGSSQQQRYFERQVRYAKRDAVIADAIGDKELFEDAARRVKSAEKKYTDFLLASKRSRRGDRTDVYAYNRNVSKKVREAQ